MCSQFNSSSSSSSSLMVISKCNFLSSSRVPILDFQDVCQNSPPQDTQVEAQLIAQETPQQQQQEQDIDNKNKEEELFEDNVKDNSSKTITPTSPQRVRQMMICPPAPKKKKAIQVTKRKLHHEERGFLDVYDEVESFFPPDLLADLGNKIKKARNTSPIL